MSVNEQRHATRTAEETALIQRAKEWLMALQGWSEEHAYTWLRRRAMNNRERMATTARRVLGAPPEDQNHGACS